MDPNLSLLEVTGEDDSLLQQVHSDDSSVNKGSNIFACSPLQCLRSLPPRAPRSEVKVGALESEKLNCSPREGINKEKMNGNKSEAPKLSVEHQQMKRKKKGGGHNLRKSLAWDRAFFTEEGVLNPLELSMISGNHCTTERELTVIHEEEQTELEGKTDIISASSQLQEIEENLFMQSSDSISIEDRKIASCSSPKPDALTRDTSAPALLAKRKVPAVNDIIRNRSKRNGCSRTVASPSPKKPDTAKAPSKESKVSKLPVPKSNVPMTTAARSRALSTAFSKINQKAHPPANVQKKAAVSRLPKNPKSVISDRKFDQAVKCSVSKTFTRRAGKDLDNSASETQRPSLQHQLVTEANKGSEVCPLQGVCDTGEKNHQAQFQTARPSGLRMPSPSLSFFSQPKASGSRSLLQKTSKPCKPAVSKIPKMRKIETNSVYEGKPKIPKMRKIEANSVYEAKSPHTLKKSAENANDPAIDVESEPTLLVVNNQKARVGVHCGALGFEDIGKQENAQSENVLEHVDIKSMKQVETYKSENVSNMEDVEFQRNKKKFHSDNDSSEVLEKEANSRDVLPNENMFVLQESRPMHDCSLQRASIEKDNLSNIVPNVLKQDEDEQIKSFICDVKASNESLMLWEKHDTSSKNTIHSGESKENSCVKTAYVNLSSGDFNEPGLDGSLEGIPCMSMDQVKEGDDEIDKHGNLSLACKDTTPSISLVVDQRLQSFHDMDKNRGGQFETQNRSIVGEINLESDHESHGNGFMIHVTSFSVQESPELFLPAINDACGCESKIVEMEECQHPRDVQSRFIQKGPAEDRYDQLVDSKLMHDRTQDNSLELDRMCGYCIAVSGTASSTKVNHVSQESGQLYENNTKYPHSTSQLCSVVQANCSSRRNDMSVSNSCTNSKVQSKEDSSPRDPLIHCDSLIVQHDVYGNFEQQATLLTSSEANKMLRENDRVIEESHLEDAQVQSSDEDLVAYSCGNDPCASVANGQFSLAIDRVNEQSHILQLQKSILAADVDSRHVNHKLHLDGDLLPANNACSEEIKNEKPFESASKLCNDIASEYSTSSYHIQAMSKPNGGSHDVDERAERLLMDAAEGSPVIFPLVEDDLNCKVITAESISSINGREDQITEEVDRRSSKHCSVSENNFSAADHLTFDGRIPHGSEVSSLESKILSEESDTEMKHQIKSGVYFAEDGGEINHLKKSVTKSKQDAPSVKPRPDAAPFSDEWLAAMEAAGEEILTMKSGAVQNSPPDKPQHEPSPWSPVRRKNQAIGPFDCTKHTNIPHSSS